MQTNSTDMYVIIGFIKRHDKNLKGNVLIKTHPEACREQLN